MTRAVDSLTVAAISMSLSLDLTMFVKLFHARFAGFCFFFCLNETILTLLSLFFSFLAMCRQNVYYCTEMVYILVIANRALDLLINYFNAIAFWVKSWQQKGHICTPSGIKMLIFSYIYIYV